MKKIYLIFMMILMINSCGDTKKESLKKAFSSYRGRYALLINKEQFKLEVYDSSLEKITSYKIGYGSNPDMKAKLFEGDNRTPEGIYYINEILSIDAGKDSESYRKIFAMNKVYFSKSKGYHKFGYPDEDLGDNAYGPRYYGINYPDENDIKNYQKALEKGEIPIAGGKPAGPGYGIAIHGNNDEGSIGQLCSSGCIRMYNRDIIDLEKYIILSTPVLIYHE